MLHPIKNWFLNAAIAIAYHLLRTITLQNIKRHSLSWGAEHLFILMQDNCTNVSKK